MKKIFENELEILKILHSLQAKRLEVSINLFNDIFKKDKPFMLLCRSRLTKAQIVIADDRLKINAIDRFNTMLLNVLVDEMKILSMNIYAKGDYMIYELLFKLSSLVYEINFLEYTS